MLIGCTQNWIKDYFTASLADTPSSPSSSKKRDSSAPADGAVRYTCRQPLYLQHTGHSRTVVGIESASDGDYLLLLDPAKKIDKTLARAAAAVPSDGGGSSKKAKLEDACDSPPGGGAFPSAPDGAALQAKPSPLRKGFGLGATSRGSELDLSKWKKHLEPFRVSLQSLGRKEEYQILYVEEGPLLSRQERAERRIVRSKVVE